MIPYFLLLAIPSLFALMNVQRLSLSLWYSVLVFYILFVGLRFEVGPDWAQYTNIHESMRSISFEDVATKVEPLSHLLFWFSQQTFSEIFFSNIIAAIIMMIGVFSFARTTINPWLAVVAATPYFIIVIGMSGIRQAMAAGIVMFLFSRWGKYSFLRRGFYILVAALFHTSALVNNIFLIIKLNIAWRYKIFLGSILFFLTLLVSFEVPAYADNILKYQQRYLLNAEINRSYGSIFHIAMIAIPAFLGFLYRRRITQHIYNKALLQFGLYAAVVVFLLNIFSSTAASRLTVYLYFLPMMIYPAMTLTAQNQLRLTTTLWVIFFHFIILIFWFQFGNVAFAYIPYQNILIDDY